MALYAHSAASAPSPTFAGCMPRKCTCFCHRGQLMHVGDWVLAQLLAVRPAQSCASLIIEVGGGVACSELWTSRIVVHRRVDFTPMFGLLCKLDKSKTHSAGAGRLVPAGFSAHDVRHSSVWLLCMRAGTCSRSSGLGRENGMSGERPGLTAWTPSTPSTPATQAGAAPPAKRA